MAYLPTRQPFFGGLEATPPTTGSAYASIFGGNSSNTWATTESWRRSLFVLAGTISNFRLTVNVDPTAAGSYVFTLLKNGSATGALSVTISNGVLSAVNTGSMTLAANDEISLQCTVSGTPVAFTVASWSMMFEPTTTKRFILAAGTGNGTGDIATTEFQPASGGYSWSSSLTSTRATVVPINATIKRWRVEMTGSQGAGRTMKYYIYKNGVQEASSEIELTASDLEVSGLSIDVVPGDYLSIGCVTTGTVGTAIFGSWGLELEPDTDGQSMISGAATTLPTGTYYFLATNFSALSGDTVEADRTTEAGSVPLFTANSLYVILTTAPGSGTSRTFTVRKNSAAGNLTVNIANTATSGSDTSHTDVFTDGNDMSIQATVSGSPASAAATWGIGVVMTWTEEVITKSLAYSVAPENRITKSLQYSLPPVTHSLTKGLRYVMTDESAWYNTEWNKRVPITVEAIKVAEDNSDFPVYVNLGNLPADFHTNVKANGADIRMTAYDGTTEVPVEVVFYDAATDTGELHFKATVDKDVDQTYWLYYGNAAATIPARNATYGSENVWTNNYKAVYHMQQDPSGNGTDAVLDSTSALNHLTPSGAPALGTGKLSGRGIVFDGVNDQLKDTDQVWPNATNATTAQFWSNFASADSGQNATVYRYGSSGDTSRHSAHSPWSNTIYFDFGDIGGNGRISSSAYTPFANKYSMFHFTSNGSTSKRIYADGNYEWGSDSVADAPSGDRTGLAIGSGVDLEYHKGTLDEVRFSTVARTEGWIATEYNNQNDVATFLAIGTAQSAPVYSITKSARYTILLPLIETLTDNFDDNSFDTAKWTSYLNGGSGSVTEQNKRIEIVSPITGTQATGIYADGSFRLYESETIIELLPYTPVTDHYWWFGVYSVDDSYIAIGISETGNVHAENQDGDIGTPVTYNPLLHRFFRIREASGTTHVEFSANGTSWTTYASTASSLYDWTECWVETYVYAQGGQSATATAYVDNIGVPVTVPVITKGVTYSVLTELAAITKSAQYVTSPGKAHIVNDNFDDNSLETTEKWFNWGGSEVAETNSQLEISVLSGGANYQGLEGENYKTLIGSHISIELVNAGDQSLDSLEVSFAVIVDEDNKVFFLITNDTLIAYRKITGTNQYITQTAYSPTSHKYLRIREASGTTYWEYSANGTSWTALHSESNPITLTSIKTEIVAGVYASEATPTTVIFDNYNIVQPLITKSLQYEVDVVDVIAITKTLAYSVAPSVGITKSLAYSTQANESITKSTKYTVTTVTGTNKSLQYALLIEQSPISKQAIYKVVDTSSESKSVTYKVSPEVGISKGLIYKVAVEVAMTKAVAYDILTYISQTKGLIYAVQPDTGMQKGLIYDVITDSFISKSLAYSINTDEVTQKSVTYDVLTSIDSTKSVAYHVTTDTAPTKSVKYTVQAPVSLTKGVIYVVQTEQSPISKSITYTVLTDSSITKAEQYAIITTAELSKTLDYEVIVDTPVSKTLTYRVVTEGLLQLSLEYVTATDNSMTKALTYSVLRPIATTKSLTYETVIRRYSKEAGTLRTTDVTLDTIYTTPEYADVATIDEIYASQAGAGYLTHHFKAYGSDLRQFIRFTWVGKASIAPTTSTVYMQLYDYALDEWVTVASNNTAAADTDFTLAALVDVAGSDYHSPDHTVTGRIYQQVS